MNKDYVKDGFKKLEDGQKVVDQISEWADMAVRNDPERKSHYSQIAISSVSLEGEFLHFYAYYRNDCDQDRANHEPVKVSLDEFEHITAQEFLAKVNAQINAENEAEKKKNEEQREKEEKGKYEELKRKFESPQA